MERLVFRQKAIIELFRGKAEFTIWGNGSVTTTTNYFYPCIEHGPIIKVALCHIINPPLYLISTPIFSKLSHITHHSLLSQAVDIHKEKVARREIGALASSKNITRAQKVVVPAQKERPQKFTRQRLDFNCLDGIGHGTKVADSTTRIDERYSGKEVSGSNLSIVVMSCVW